MRYNNSLIFILICIIAVFTGCSPANNDSADTHLQKAKEFLAANNYNSAQIELKNTLHLIKIRRLLSIQPIFLSLSLCHAFRKNS